MFALGLGADPFVIVNVESEGPYAPERIFLESISVMRDKIARIRKAALVLGEGRDVEGDVVMADVGISCVIIKVQCKLTRHGIVTYKAPAPDIGPKFCSQCSATERRKSKTYRILLPLSF